MEIVKEIPKCGKLIIELDLNIHLATLLDVDEYVADHFIRDFYGVKYFQSFDNDNWGSESEEIEETPISGSIYLTYPLSVNVKIDVKEVETIGSLLWQIAKIYEQIYQEEETSTKDLILNDDDRGTVYNRNKTNGKYGIWGHDIGDLYFERIFIYDNEIIGIGIGS
jgi:hypothetical protein